MSTLRGIRAKARAAEAKCRRKREAEEKADKREQAKIDRDAPKDISELIEQNKMIKTEYDEEQDEDRDPG